MPEEWVKGWVKKVRGRERWPLDWQRMMMADWRVDFRMWDKPKKNAGRKNGSRERWQIEKDLAAMREQVRTHPKMTWPGNKPLPKSLTDEFAGLVARRTALEKELNDTAT